MIVLGLTGSVGMGKSVVADMFRDLGVPVHDADAAVHAAMAPGGQVVDKIAALFPSVIKDSGIDRAALGHIVFADAQKLKQLESLLHPLVRESEEAFVNEARRQDKPLCVLDIPLLFETGAEARVDAVAVVTAPENIQRARVLARPGMTEERLARLRARQMPDADKQAKADCIIDNGGTLDATRRQVAALAARLAASSR